MFVNLRSQLTIIRQIDNKIIGNEKNLNIGVYLIKEPNGEWKLIQFYK